MRADCDMRRSASTRPHGRLLPGRLEPRVAVRAASAGEADDPPAMLSRASMPPTSWRSSRPLAVRHAGIAVATGVHPLSLAAGGAGHPVRAHRGVVARLLERLPQRAHADRSSARRSSPIQRKATRSSSGLSRRCHSPSPLGRASSLTVAPFLEPRSSRVRRQGRRGELTRAARIMGPRTRPRRRRRAPRRSTSPPRPSTARPRPTCGGRRRPCPPTARPAHDRPGS